ncbi:MAG: 1-acyl-sn-glycerol-3-phosphate acyltransferase, partial [Betaproteobacteria bacterium]|nr:1-acyl-sn-glycerol-3-phosphate acyltransferase [Betaproteobacteria bacterium]
MKIAVLLRSALFALFQLVVTPFYALIALATFPLAPLARYRVISGWARLNVAAARLICGIRYRVIGAENIPAEPCIILAKHQSAWETLAFQVVLPPHVWVLKRELLRVPFFGWGLAMLSPIAIDRASGTRALKQTLEQGRERLHNGFSIMIFPEGTRIPPGARGRYHPGGAWLAIKTGVPVLPVAHNAGECWRRNAFLKHPGMITVSIGA